MAVNRNRAAAEGDDFIDERKSQPVALGSVRLIALIKFIKDVLLRRLVNAAAIVRDIDNDFILCQLQFYVDHSAVWRKLDGILYEVIPHLIEQAFAPVELYGQQVQIKLYILRRPFAFLNSCDTATTKSVRSVSMLPSSLVIRLKLESISSIAAKHERSSNAKKNVSRIFGLRSF